MKYILLFIFSMKMLESFPISLTTFSIIFSVARRVRFYQIFPLWSDNDSLTGNQRKLWNNCFLQILLLAIHQNLSVILFRKTSKKVWISVIHMTDPHGGSTCWIHMTDPLDGSHLHWRYLNVRKSLHTVNLNT